MRGFCIHQLYFIKPNENELYLMVTVYGIY